MTSPTRGLEWWRSRWGALLGAVLFGLVGCSPRRAAELLVPDGHFMLTRNLRYGPAPRQRLDVYQPRKVRRAPVVVFLHGGRWKYGSKDDYRLLGNALTRRGFLVVIPSYRIYPDTIFPAWVRDGASATRWARDNAARFGGDTAQIFVVGHSAGAHTVALLALDERYLREAGLPAGATGTVKAFVSLAGPNDTVWTDADVQALMGPRQGWPATYPRNHLSGAHPPLLLLHGAADETVHPRNSVRLAQRIRDRGGCAPVRVYPGVGHVEIAVAFAAPWLRIAPVMRDVESFLRGAAGCGPEGCARTLGCNS